MHNYFKRGISLLLAFAMTFALTACSGSAKITEDNITKTVELVEKALRDFDRQTLKKYVNSKTLNYIFTIAKDHEQFDELGKAIFEKLELDVKSIDLEGKTVTLAVKNRDMALIGERYSSYLTTRFKTTELLKKLGDDEFLDTALKVLKAQISRAIIPDNPTEITINIKQGSRNLVLSFDEDAEDAVSGGLLTAIVNAVTPNKQTSDSEQNQ